VTLKLSHQWPKPQPDENGAYAGYSGDFRAILATRFAKQIEEETDGQVKINIFPNNSLVGATEQYDAMMKGSTDMSVFPLDYAGGKVPAFNVTLMPTLIQNHTQAQNWQHAEIGPRIERLMEDNGVKVVTWLWNAGATGSKGNPIVAPSDVKGNMTMRAAGSRVEDMLKKAGAGITSMSSSEMYGAFQTGVLDAGVTSTGSWASYNLYEQVDGWVSPTKNTFWVMFEPLIISMDSWNKLSSEQQKAVDKVGDDLQDFAYSAAEEDDVRVEKLFKENGVNVVEMPDPAFQEWQKIAQKVFDEYANNVENGGELINLAQQVPADRSLKPSGGGTTSG
jgi:TRAP-type C4-dicarboxylate transport system substrate-binding protein